MNIEGINHANGCTQLKVKRNISKKVWKLTGRLFELKEVLTVNEQSDIPIATAFQKL